MSESYRVDWFNVMMAGMVIGVVAGVLGLILIMTTFPSSEAVPWNVWLLFWYMVVLSVVLGGIIEFTLIKSSHLRNLQSYVNTFFSYDDHRTCVNGVLKVLAVQADNASKHAIDLRTNGARSLAKREDLGPDCVLEECRRIQDGADNYFHTRQAHFYKNFDLAAKFTEDFNLKLEERKFKAYA